MSQTNNPNGYETEGSSALKNTAGEAGKVAGESAPAKAAAATKSILGIWGVKLPSFYAVVVVFKDEPYVEYIYFAHNDILQFDHRITDEGRKQGITESDLKHYVPLESQ
ncbi:hypothetical protein ACFOU2_23250 [Bacillus songklensis]|uniref:Uncharacterized protein n=1 Tax=Bacillus songklensis TaxID=1069116 RepID=A0ABV8BA48_9BACI